MKPQQAALERTNEALGELPLVQPQPQPVRVAPAQAEVIRVRLWDLPTRIFHWALVTAVTTAIVTAKVGGSWMTLHGQAGLAIIGLVSFRLVWGFIGPEHARFLSFAPTPGRIHDYLKGRWQGIGHNPLGALSVFALLALLGAQSVTGLFSNDDIDFAGPFAALIDEGLSGRLTDWHHQLSNVLLVLLGLHIAAIVFYLWVKKDNLVKPMVTGWKDVGRPPEPVVMPVRRIGAKEKAGARAVRKVNVRVRPVALVIALAVALGSVYVASGQLIPPPAATTPAQATDQATSTAAPAW